tara:strand:+ start:260 stop:577 length:318 start_codon:yes stop_codon:yes gene_type:complete
MDTQVSTTPETKPVIKSEVMYKVYIPKDLAHLFKKGEGFHTLTEGGEFNPPVFRASCEKARKYRLYVFICHPNGSYTPYIKGLKANEPPTGERYSVKWANAEAAF